MCWSPYCCCHGAAKVGVGPPLSILPSGEGDGWGEGGWLAGNCWSGELKVLTRRMLGRDRANVGERQLNSDMFNKFCIHLKSGRIYLNFPPPVTSCFIVFLLGTSRYTYSLCTTARYSYARYSYSRYAEKKNRYIEHVWCFFAQYSYSRYLYRFLVISNIF